MISRGSSRLKRELEMSQSYNAFEWNVPSMHRSLWVSVYFKEIQVTSVIDLRMPRESVL